MTPKLPPEVLAEVSTILAACRAYELHPVEHKSDCDCERLSDDEAKQALATLLLKYGLGERVYDQNRLGTYIFVGDKDQIDNLGDLYWSYVMQHIAKNSASYDHYTLDYCKRNMGYAGFDQVGIHKMLAEADQYARERLVQLKQIEDQT